MELENDPKTSKLTKPYDPKETEDRIYKTWEEGGFFKPENSGSDDPKKTFSMVLPPPNVTGHLHVGHAMTITIEDILTRYHRMRGYKTLWLPGTDHAAIATQAKVEKELYKKEKKTRHDFSREEFLKKVEDFAKVSHDTIIGQTKKMGASLDWDREAYTLDEKRTLAVRTAFKKMYDLGLIYRGHRIVNWDPRLQTTVSDDELERREEATNFYYLKYGPFIIGTARPETKFGDKHVVMHPDDKRYAKYKHGQTIDLEWINGPITATIIKDESVDMEFGTGVMTITPWHDATDFGIAGRHNLDKEQVIDYHGKLLPIAGGEFEGIHIKKARPLIVEKLKEKDLIDKIDEKYIHNIAINSRGEEIIEPQIMEQWFVGVEREFKIPHSNINGIASGDTVTLKGLMRHVVEKGEINIVPDRFEKTYNHWIDNLHDWCISRQIWYGHQIPVWYCDKCKETIVSIDTPEKCSKCGGELRQDSDTLDTWFSSGLWTFSTLGWPEETPDLKNFHPTDVLETGYDLIFFWVARMILMTTTLVGEIPFKNVYLHGMVRDKQGRKMSKSLGNIIDPLDMIEKFGTDALRMSLIIGTSAGNDSKMSEDKIKAYKHFANKIWNASRFVLSNVHTENLTEKPNLTDEDTKRLEELDENIADITVDLENFRFYLAGEKIYHYFWHTFADVIIEESKEILQGDDEPKKKSKEWMLHEILTKSLKVLHPFMPFVTEEVWSMLPKTKEKHLINANWPE